MTIFAEAGPADWDRNAVIGGARGEWAYVQGFRDAGDALLDRALEAGSQDTLFYPAAFSYRHAVELALKMAMLYGVRLVAVATETGVVDEADSQQASKIQAALDKTHGIGQLLDDLDWLLGLFTDERWPDDIVNALREMAEVDPSGQVFRYAELTRGKGPSLPRSIVDIENLRRFGPAVDFILGGTIGWLDYQIDNMHEYLQILRDNMP